MTTDNSRAPGTAQWQGTCLSCAKGPGSIPRSINATKQINVGSQVPGSNELNCPCYLSLVVRVKRCPGSRGCPVNACWMDEVTNTSWCESSIWESTVTKRPATSNEACSVCFIHRLSDSLDTLSEISSNKQNHSYPGKMMFLKPSLKYFFTFTHWNVFLLFSICINIFLSKSVWNASV